MAKAWQGKAQQCKGKAGTSTDEICKGFALIRNESQRRSGDMRGKGWAMLAMEKQSKDRFATAETGVRWRSVVSNGNVLLRTH